MKPNNPIVRVGGNWLLQGMTAMDPTEIWFKVILEAVVFLPFLALSFGVGFQNWVGVFGAFVVSHTVLWIFYAEKFVALKAVGLKVSSLSATELHLTELARRAAGSRGIDAVAITGSYAEGRFHPRSDIDVRVLRAPGLRAGVSACLWALGERTRCSFNGVPLDLLICDHADSFRRKVPDKTAIALLDRNDFLRTLYSLRAFPQPQGRRGALTKP